MSRKVGNIFQDAIENSCEKGGIFYHNIKDVMLPPDVRRRVRLPKNKYDSIIYYKGYLFPMELKTTDKKIFSMASIQEHQLSYLDEATYYQGVLPSVLINFRETKFNNTYLIPIQAFLEYKNFASNHYEDVRDSNIPNPYNSKINRASIPEAICREIGISVNSSLIRVNYLYDMERALDDLISFGRR